MARASILSVAGDDLPVFKRKKVRLKSSREIVKRIRRESPQYKDGESPGQEWSVHEVAAIRVLANPELASRTAAAKAAKVNPRTIDKWQRNPYFMNAIYVLTNSFLLQSRAKVLGAVIRHAQAGSVQDRTLYFRLTGDLKDEKRIRTEQHQHHTFGEMEDSEVEQWMQDNIDDDLSDGSIDTLIKDSRKKPKEDE